MISRAHRFHGRNSLRYVYQNGKTVRGPLFALKFVSNPRRKSYRLAVVVSRKVNKSAVARNRMRRRLYGLVQGIEDQIQGPYDIVVTVFSSTVMDESYESLARQLNGQLEAAGIINKA